MVLAVPEPTSLVNFVVSVHGGTFDQPSAVSTLPARPQPCPTYLWFPLEHCHEAGSACV